MGSTLHHLDETGPLDWTFHFAKRIVEDNPHGKSSDTIEKGGVILRTAIRHPQNLAFCCKEVRRKPFLRPTIQHKTNDCDHEMVSTRSYLLCFPASSWMSVWYLCGKYYLTWKLCSHKGNTKTNMRWHKENFRAMVGQSWWSVNERCYQVNTYTYCRKEFFLYLKMVQWFRKTLFIEDGMSCHTMRMSLQIPRPHQPSDMKPIEHIWNIMISSLHKKIGKRIQSQSFWHFCMKLHKTIFEISSVTYLITSLHWKIQ